MEKNCGCQETPLACVECGTPVLDRVNYYDGQFLVARDLSDEQRFLLAKHREHVHRLHAAGTVCGLKVTQHPDPACRDRYIVIEPGLALDCCGREIHVTEKVCVDLRAELSAADPPGPDDKTLLISVCYDECRTEFAPALYSDCACSEDRCEPSRVRETFQVKLQMAQAVPLPQPADFAGVDVARDGTLNYANAFRGAYDSNLSRIYVLNAANPAQIAVYDSDTGCLLGSIATGVQALDLAASPDGETLYLVIHTTGPDAFKLRALNVSDLTAVTQVGTDLDAGAGAVDPAKPPRVLCSSTRVFVLNAVANKVFIFDTSPALALYTTFDETEEFRDIAVTADGTWLFVAAPTRVWAAKVPTLTGTPTVDQIAEADAPTRVAVSGDGLRLFVGTDAKTVHLFLIQETPVAFPEVGSGVSVTDTIVSMAASDAGEWLYVLGNDASGKGQIRVVDGDQIDPSPATAVGNPVPAGDTPEEILLDPTGRWLYVVFNGTASAPCAGAAIFHLTEKDCEGILWKALDGCPECADPSCLLLAAVSDYSLGATVTDNRIDNRVRPLAPSTETLRELIECCCHAKSETGAKGPRGDAGMAATVAVGTTTTGVPGTSATVSNSGTSSAAVFDFVIPRGADGPPGASSTITVGTTTTGAAGASAAVTNSGTPSAAILDFVIPHGADGAPGAASTVSVGTTTTGAPGTSASVTNSGTPSAAVLNFTIPRGADGADAQCCEPGLTRIIALSWIHDRVGTPFATVGDNPAVIVQFGPGRIDVPDLVAAARIFRVEMEDNSNDLFRCFCELKGTVIPVQNVRLSGGRIRSADPFAGAPTTTDALAFQFSSQTKNLIATSGAEVRVTLLGDFLTAGGRAIDAEFPRAELPTGDHPSGAKEGIQGGTFLSWFWIKARAKA